MHTNVQPSFNARTIPNWSALVRQLVEDLGEGEVSIEVVNHQVTYIEVEELTSVFNVPASVVSDGSIKRWPDSLAELPERYKN